MQRSIWAVVLGGGLGIDMQPLMGNGKSKYLINILGKPLIKYPIDAIRNLGIRRITIASNQQLIDESEIDYVKYGDNETDALREVAQYSLKGTTVIIAYGDVVMPMDAYRLLLDTHIGSGNSLTALVVPIEDAAGYIKINLTEGQGISTAIRSKEHQPGYVLAGALAIEGEHLAQISSSDFIDLLSKSGGGAALWSGWWIDVKHPWDLLAVIRNELSSLSQSRISARASISSKASIEGVVIIDDEATIDHNATIRGPAYIGRKAYIGTNALVRNYASIEEGSIIGAGVEITESLIQPYSTIGRGSFIGSSIIGEHSVMEPGVVTLTMHHEEAGNIGRRKLGMIIGNNVRIGANSVISPGSIVKPNTIIPPLSRV